MYLCQANHALIYLGTMNKKKIIFILNPISGTVSKAGIPGLIEERLDKEKFDCRIAETKYAGHATELAQQAARHGHSSLRVGERTCEASEPADESEEMHRHPQRL